MTETIPKKDKEKKKKPTRAPFLAVSLPRQKKTRLEKPDKILANVERDRHETVQQEEVVEKLHSEVAGEAAIPLQHLVATKKEGKWKN